MLTHRPLEPLEGRQRSPSREADFYSWLNDQTAALQAHRSKHLDWDGLAEELEAMARSERNEVISHLRNILANFLKLRYSAVRRSEKSWTGTILRARLDLSLRVDDAASLKNALPEFLETAYKQARALAAHEMGLDKHQAQQLFEKDCAWDIEQIQDEDFFPEVAPSANGRSR
jgi:Domain of unknown function DUF29